MWYSLLLAMTLTAAQADVNSDWSRWRGVNQGVTDQTGLPVEWSAQGQAVRWRVALRGKGNSSPIISRGRIFVTMAYPDHDADLVGMVIAASLSLGTGLWLLISALSLLRYRRSTSPTHTAKEDPSLASGVSSTETTQSDHAAGAPNPDPRGEPGVSNRPDFLRLGVVATAVALGSSLLLMQPDAPPWRWLLGAWWSDTTSGWLDDPETTSFWPLAGTAIVLSMVALTGWFRKNKIKRIIPSVALVCVAIYWAVLAPVTREGLLLVLSYGCLAILLVSILPTDRKTDTDIDASANADPSRTKAILRRIADAATRFDALLGFIAAFAFLCMATLASWHPDWYWAPGNPASSWWAGGVIASIGMLAALRFASDHSGIRALGALLLIGALAVLWNLAPEESNVRNADPMIPNHWIVASIVLLATAIWQILLIATRLMGHRARDKSTIWNPPSKTGRTNRAIQAAVLFVMVATCLGLANFHNLPYRWQYALASFDFASGRQLWHQTLFSRPLDSPDHPWGIHANPTPSADGKNIVAHFNAGTACLDYDGKVLWSREDLHTSVNSFYGAASSPLVTDGLVIVAIQHDSLNVKEHWPSRLIAYQLDSGKIKWQLEDDQAFDSYITPVVRRVGSSAELITATGQSIVAYDLETGKKLWSHPTRLKQLVAGMIIKGDHLWLGGGTYPPHSLRAVEMKGRGTETKTRDLWKTQRGTPACVSPVLYQDRLYVLTDLGVMSCLDPLTGDRIWAGRLPKRGKFYASLVAGDNKIYAMSVGGLISVVKVGEDFELLAENDLGERLLASPAVADRCLLIRTDAAMYCIQSAAHGPPASKPPKPEH